jgi:hypothetical protein
VLCAFDLIELDGEDLRHLPIEDRKRTLAELLRKKTDGIALNAHYEGDGANIYKLITNVPLYQLATRYFASAFAHFDRLPAEDQQSLLREINIQISKRQAVAALRGE